MTTTAVPSPEVKEDEKFPIWTIIHISIPIVTIITVIAIIIYIRRAVRGKRAKSNVKLHGKTAIVTGSNTGIGKETVRDLAKRGARVIMACRNLDKANEAAFDIRTLCPNADIVTMKLDLASFDSIRKFAKDVLDSEPHIDILVNNAGMLCSKYRTEDSYDMMFGTNHLGPFLLTNLLLDRLKKSTPARIVTVASVAHNFVFGMNWDDLNFDKPSNFPIIKAYSHTKLANILFSKELSKRLEGTGVTTYSLHPGVIKTELGRDIEKDFGCFWRTYVKITLAYFSKTPVQGAQTTIYCAVDEKLANKTGLYYSNCGEATPTRAARNTEAAKKLWELSVKMVGIENEYC